MGLMLPLFLSAGALVPLYLVSMDPSKDWVAAPLSDFDSIGNKSGQVTFIYIALLTIQIVSKQLHNIKIGK